MSSALDRLKNLTTKLSGYETARKENLKILEDLYKRLHVQEKVENFTDIFLFKAINLSGVLLNAEELGEIKKGKYLQILAIAYDKEADKKSKNISLAYFGRVENVDKKLKDDVVSFVLRWRFEKSFITLEHYHNLLESHAKSTEME
jgi:cytosine/adenosine deaminase-related metal-dependent hydrolase